MNVIKKLSLFSLIGFMVLIVACDKGTDLPAYTPPVTVNFTADSVHHTSDSVNVGDTIYLSATGSMYDTTQNIYVYLISSYTASSVSTTYNYGSATSPVKISRTIGTQFPINWLWSSTIALPGATNVPHKTVLTISGNYIYQLNLSSQQGKVALIDAGIKKKTIYVR
jgi:hypothetical protein